MDMSKLISVKDAAKELGLEASTLRTWITKGKITSYKHPISRRLFVNREDVFRSVELVKTAPNKD